MEAALLPVERRRGAPPDRRGRLRRLLLVDPPRREPGPDDAARQRTPILPNWRHLPGRLPRAVGHGPGQRRATSSGPRGWCPTRDGVPRLRAHGVARHRARGGLRGRHRRDPHPAGRRRSPRVRRGAAQRLVGPRHPGLRVPATRAQPGQELRHHDLPVGRHPRRAPAVPGRAARPGPDTRPVLAGATTVGARPQPGGVAQRPAHHARRPSPTCTGPSPSSWPTSPSTGPRRRTGDLFGSGTVSGPTTTERGSLIELTWRGAEPLTLADGTTRTLPGRRRHRHPPGLVRRRRRSPASASARPPRRALHPAPLSVLR